MNRPIRKRGLNTFLLLMTLYCCVSGGPFGLEPLVASSGAGMALLLILVVPIVWALPDSLITAELTAAIPEEGGYIVWVRRAMGEGMAFVNGWWTWLYAIVDATVYPVLITKYLLAILGEGLHLHGLDSSPLKFGIAATFIAIFTLLNIRGSRAVGLAGTAFVLILLLPHVLMVILGAYRLFQHPLPAVHSFVPAGTSPKDAALAGLGIVLWNYLGWDSLSTVAGEVEHPERAYPKAMLIGVPMVAISYLLPTLIGLAFFPDTSKWQDGTWPAIAQAVGGPWLFWLMAIAAVVSQAALYVASMLGSSRVPYALAEMKTMPQFLVDLHPRYGTPWKSIILVGLLNLCLVQLSFQELAGINVVLYASALVLEGLALIILRIREPDLPRPFRVPGGLPVAGLLVLLPLVLGGFLALNDWQDSEAPPYARWITLGALISGPLLWWAQVGYRRWRR